MKGGERGWMKGGTLLVVDGMLVVDDTLVVDGVLVVDDVLGGCSRRHYLCGPLGPLHIAVGAECWPQWVASWHRGGRSDGESRGERREA